MTETPNTQSNSLSFFLGLTEWLLKRWPEKTEEINFIKRILEKEKNYSSSYAFKPCNCKVSHPSFVQEMIMNYDALPPSLAGWSRYRIEYGFECSCPEGLIYLPPNADPDVIEKLLNNKNNRSSDNNHQKDSEEERY